MRAGAGQARSPRPALRTLDPCRLVGWAREFVGTFGPGDVYRPELFPGRAILLHLLLA